MLFNIDKCKVIHFGHSNTKQDYVMGGSVLEVVNSERDLGVIVQDDLKVSMQCYKVVQTANKVLDMIHLRTRLSKLYYTCTNLWLDRI